MSLPLWGSLEKAQDNSQTIEEAIDQAILDHENDPTAHLGTNESLQSHKSEEVIDHPALSLVPDKFSNAQSFLFLSIIPFISSALDNCVAYNSNPFLQLYQNNSYSGNGTYTVADFAPTDMGYADGDLIFDFISFGYGGAGTWQNELAFGFGKIQFKNGYYRVGYYTTSWQYSSWFSLSVDLPLRFRFEYLSSDETLNVYISDNIVFTTSYVIAFEGDEFLVSALVNRGSSSYTYLGIANLKFWFNGF